ncbi:MAG: 5-formyltetrahydrofolate cyclo-ligase [Gloeobacteraceae cyanobacterium ES-bin-316]|nr:5-formyltetrahydrofolate cyclo-ligase [Ferruginibacter sp.]
MHKEELRKVYLQKRAELSAAQKTKAEDLMLIQFQKLDIDIPSLIMTYAASSKMNEFDPQLITDYCYFKNPDQVLFYPVIHPTAPEMLSVIVDDETRFEPNRFGISEPVNATPMFPEEIDLIIVPLLAYSVKGHRVGYGKGYYDRFLKQCKNDVVKIGFSYFEAEPIITGTNRYDVKLDYCISPQRIYSF